LVKGFETALLKKSDELPVFVGYITAFLKKKLDLFGG
jgi:hypothetical protein